MPLQISALVVRDLCVFVRVTRHGCAQGALKVLFHFEMPIVHYGITMFSGALYASLSCITYGNIAPA